MAKAQFHRNQKVWVSTVGTWAVIEKIVPVWARGFDEPVRITYDVGLGREFLAGDLMAEDAGVSGTPDGEAPWRILRARNKWQAPEDCGHHPYPGTFPVVVTDKSDWGVEMEGGFGLGQDRLTVSGTSVDVKQDWEVGIFADGYAPLSNNIDLIGRVGYARTQITASAGATSLAGQGNGPAVGIGLRQFFGANGYRLDYTHHFYQSSSSVDSFGVTYVHKF